MLQIERLEAGYGDVPVLKDVSLHIDANETVAIIGPNGAGKSTLVAALCGLILPRGGRILHRATDVTQLPAHERARRGLGVVLEGRHLFGELTLRQNLTLAAAHARHDARAQAAPSPASALDDVLELFPFMRARLDDAVELMSGGEQQMVALARALLLRPEVLILDEPSTGLAPLIVKQIMTTIGVLRSRGMSIVLVEQNVALAAEVADRGYVLSVGRVVHEVAKGEWPRFLADDSLVKAYLGG
jgi:ABC-type branched-subunit amino acid transport system ATPase component